MSKLTYNTKLVFQSDSDKDKILAMLKGERLVWNECSKAKFDIPSNSIVLLHAAFYAKFRRNHPTIPCQLVISAQQSVLSTYRSIKTNKQKLEKPPEKKKLSIRLDKNSYSYKNGIFSIISLGKRVKCSPYLYPKLKELFSKYRFCDPLLFEKGGEIWIAMTFDIPEVLSKNTSALGIDLGCRVFAATSEGNLYIDKKFNGEKRKLRHLKRSLQSKSKSSKSAKRHLKKLRRKEANKNKNFLHHLANKIIKDTNADILVLENLKSIKVKKNKYQNKNRISQFSFYQLKLFLTYKALLKEKTVIEVSPAWTSQIDNVTSKKEGERRGRRFYAKSGKIYDSDINGAINIGLRSKHPVSLGSARNGAETYGQATVNSPIVGGSHSQAAIL